MTTTLQNDNPTATFAGTTRRPIGWRHVLFAGVPAAWAAVALLHPLGGESLYGELHDQVGSWLALHFAQLLLSIGLAAALWQIVGHRHDPAAKLTKLALPVYLAFFGAFDAVAGFATGLTVHHANSLAGAERAGAASTADYLMNNQVAANNSPIAAVATAALVLAIAGTAMCLRRAGATRSTWAAIAAGVLLATHAGPAAAVGLALLACGLIAADRAGFTRARAET
jgi:hypothetical protein